MAEFKDNYRMIISLVGEIDIYKSILNGQKPKGQLIPSFFQKIGGACFDRAVRDEERQ